MINGPDSEPKDETGKLRRWVSNLQLESWQLELLITGFSIFLLATSVEGYSSWRDEFLFSKLRPDAGTINPIVAVSVLFIINSIPIVLQFLLINLLVHLLLRGFWIGIVGLSSVSSTIDFDSLKLKGNFRKFIPQKVRSLDSLIVYLDKISSVIFAYTYLLVFSILSVVIVTSFIFTLMGLTTWLAAQYPDSTVLGLVNILVFIIILILLVAAIIFFLDTILFSAFKKSKWFNVLYYPIYRFYSVISLSIIYRSIYYHLITNFKKKQIITVVVILLGFFLMFQRVSGWTNFKFFPKTETVSEYYLTNNMYDDLRVNAYVSKASIPSKYIKSGFLEVFIRYQAIDNELLNLLCPDANKLDWDLTLGESFRAGVESQMDTTFDINELLSGGEAYANLVEEVIGCISELYEIKIDGEIMDSGPYFFHIHSNRSEKGYLAVLDVSNLERGRHVLEINKKSQGDATFMLGITEESIRKRLYSKINFWIE